MVCNLNTTKKPDGSLVSSTLIICGNYTSYDNNFVYGCNDDENSPSVDWTRNQGRLYTWASAMNQNASIDRETTSPLGTQGICPNGYVISSNYAWKLLEKAMGGVEAIAADDLTTGYKNSGVGTKLKNGGDSKLNFLKTGQRKTDNTFASSNLMYLWSSSENTGTTAWIRYLKMAQKRG